MSEIRVEQSDLPVGYTIIESIHAILGTGTARVVAIRGGDHPKMRLLVKNANTEMVSGSGLSGAYSFALSRVSTTGGEIFTVSHKDGSVAGQTAAETEVNEIYPFAPAATTDEPTFEADEDVILTPSTACGNAADAALVVLKFEVVN